MILVLALLVLFAVIAAWLVLPMLNADSGWPHDPASPADRRVSQWSDERDRLVGEMVALDMARAEGRMAEADYNVQRSIVMEEAEKAAAQLGKLRTETAERAPIARTYPWLAAGLAAAVVVCGTAMTMFLNQSDIVAGKSPHADGRIPLPENMSTAGAPVKNADGQKGAVIGADGTPDVGAMVARLEARVKEPAATVDDIVMLARSYRVLNREEDSLALYRRARSMAPQNEELQLVVASALIRAADQKNHAEGEQIVDGILSKDPKKPEALWLKSLGLIQRHEINSARDMLTQLSGLVSENSDAKKAVGELLASLSQVPADSGSKTNPHQNEAPPATPPANGETKK